MIAERVHDLEAISLKKRGHSNVKKKVGKSNLKSLNDIQRLMSEFRSGEVNTGWIKFHREILDTELWNDVTTFRLFSYLLLRASHKDGVKIKGIELSRGQWLRSYRKLAQDLSYKEGRGLKEYSLRTIGKCINKLVKSESITIQETEQGTLFTIVNYAKYQDETDIKAETVNCTGNEQETNGKRTGNKNKNANNAKNAKNKKDFSLQINHLRKRYSLEQLKAIDDYFEMIRHTRVSGSISDSVKLKIYEDWDKHPCVCVEYGVKVHTENVQYHSRKENYTLGIIRNTTAEEAANKLFNFHLNNQRNREQSREEKMNAARDMEIEFGRWITDGNNPEEFDRNKYITGVKK